MAATNLIKYTVKEKDGREVVFVVGPRLDCYFQEKIETLAKYKINIEGILSVTDRIVRTNSSYKKSAWFPWIEGKYPTEEVVFGSLTTLRHWVEDLRLSTIYIHCDAGSHRSPTIMGFYLYAFSSRIESFEMELMFLEDVDKDEENYYSSASDYASSYIDKEEFGKNYKVLLPAIAETFYTYNLGFGDISLEALLDDLGWRDTGFPRKKQGYCDPMFETVEITQNQLDEKEKKVLLEFFDFLDSEELMLAKHVDVLTSGEIKKISEDRDTIIASFLNKE